MPLAPTDVNRLIANFLALRVHHRFILDAPHLDLSGLLPPSPLTKRVILNHICLLHPWTWIDLIANFLALRVHHRYILDALHLDLSGLLPLSPLTKRVILNHIRLLHPWTWIVLIANFLALSMMALVADLPDTRISYCITLSHNSNS